MNIPYDPLSFLDPVINGISAGAFLGFFAFLIFYLSFGSWRDSGPGRALLYAIGSLNAVVLMNTIHLFTGKYPYIQLVRIPIYTMLFVSAWWLTYTLVSELRAGHFISWETFFRPKKSLSK